MVSHRIDFTINPLRIDKNMEKSGNTESVDESINPSEC